MMTVTLLTMMIGKGHSIYRVTLQCIAMHCGWCRLFIFTAIGLALYQIQKELFTSVCGSASGNFLLFNSALSAEVSHLSLLSILSFFLRVSRASQLWRGSLVPFHSAYWFCKAFTFTVLFQAHKAHQIQFILWWQWQWWKLGRYYIWWKRWWWWKKVTT